MLGITWLPENQAITAFPIVDKALASPDGLLAIGGDLSVDSLLTAYRSGVFPWFEERQPILWWSPSVRAIIHTGAIHISKNMRKLYRNQRYHLRADTAFSQVIDACSARTETWITKNMRKAYNTLHKKGIAHSIEVFDDKANLVGGLYGVFVKNIFCGESMFSTTANTSKLALIHLAKFLQTHHCDIIDCQLPTSHLMSMGAIEISREQFVAHLDRMEANTTLLEQTWAHMWHD